MIINGLPDWIDDKMFVRFLRETVLNFSFAQFSIGCFEVSIDIDPEMDNTNIFLTGYNSNGNCIKTKSIYHIDSVINNYKVWCRNYKLDILDDK